MRKRLQFLQKNRWFPELESLTRSQKAAPARCSSSNRRTFEPRRASAPLAVRPEACRASWQLAKNQRAAAATSFHPGESAFSFSYFGPKQAGKDTFSSQAQRTPGSESPPASTLRILSSSTIPTFQIHCSQHGSLCFHV